MTAPNSRERILPRPIEEEMKQSFINYSMSVIVSRALPDVRDGLKPVHRRILYAMNELGLAPGRPYKKSATVVGDVLGKYHPHGDSVGVRRDGAHGAGFLAALSAGGRPGQLRLGRRRSRRGLPVHRGAPDAHRGRDARRTSRRTPSTSSRTSTTGCRSRRCCRRDPEPARQRLQRHRGGHGHQHSAAQPARGRAGAVELLVDNPDATIDDLLKHIKGPDFPTGGYIYGASGIARPTRPAAAASSCGRAGADRGEGVHGRAAIIVTEIPYQVNKATLHEQIAELVQEKKIEGITRCATSPTATACGSSSSSSATRSRSVVLNQLYKHTADAVHLRRHHAGAGQRRSPR